MTDAQARTAEDAARFEQERSARNRVLFHIAELDAEVERRHIDNDERLDRVANELEQEIVTRRHAEQRAEKAERWAVAAEKLADRLGRWYNVQGVRRVHS